MCILRRRSSAPGCRLFQVFFVVVFCFMVLWWALAADRSNGGRGLTKSVRSSQHSAINGHGAKQNISIDGCFWFVLFLLVQVVRTTARMRGDYHRRDDSACVDKLGMGSKLVGWTQPPLVCLSIFVSQTQLSYSRSRVRNVDVPLLLPVRFCWGSVGKYIWEVNIDR